MVSRVFRNPILPGFYPDPSICRVDTDYYLINSTFEYFPGVPISHSRDLVHWRQIGHILDRPSQLDLDGVLPSQGIYAPTLRYYDERFYMVTTLRRPDGDGFRDDNFVVTAENPAGPWSEPYILIDQPGVIDPSLFFDEDGRAWFTANRRVADPPYPGYREVWMREFDYQNMRLVGDETILWNGALRGASAPEAPHLYRVNGIYYLMIAEGGTFHDHAVTIARSAAIEGPYQGNPRNPILTHRHLGLDYPITNPGHADLVETQQGEWWMVALASRPYGGYYYNLGRETFLMPVRWEEGWPVVSPGHGRVEWEYIAPDLPEQRWPSIPACDHFDQAFLAPCWNFLRTPRVLFWSLRERPGYLRLKLQPETLAELANPPFVGRRQQHHNMAVRVAMEFTPYAGHESAGLALLQNKDFHFRLVCTHNARQEAEIRLVRRAAGSEEVLGIRPTDVGRHYFKVEAIGQEYSFYYASEPEAWRPLVENVNGRILSTQVAGGFVGAYVGLYASSNGSPSDNVADFDYLEYASLDG